MDGHPIVDYSTPKGIPASRAAKHSIVMDLTGWANSPDKFSWHQIGNGSKYNILFGDGSVQVLDDSEGIWIEAFVNNESPIKLPRPQAGDYTHPIGLSRQDYTYFDIIDQYFGAPAWVVDRSTSIP